MRIISYLKERRQYVQWHGKQSEVLEAEYDVLQGFISWPLLFLLHIDYLIKVIKSTKLLCMLMIQLFILHIIASISMRKQICDKPEKGRLQPCHFDR